MKTVKAISIRQPWAWLILYGGKNVENRTWRTRYRGPLAIHAGKVLWTKKEEQFRKWFYLNFPLAKCLPPFSTMERGGLVGVVKLAGCTLDTHGQWSDVGMWHWILRNPQSVPMRPFTGRQGLFEVPRDLFPEEVWWKVWVKGEDHEKVCL